MSEPRVRFAPSPTGMFHVGSARSALYNWAVAKQRGGVFVLRIEDTDAERNRPEWTEGILSALAAIGISVDDPTFEGPYFQSDNAPAHRHAAARLIASGLAYYCSCSREEVTARTGSEHLGYDGFCRDAGRKDAPGLALRFRTPDDGVTVIDDLVRGRVEFPNAAMEDFVVARGDGSPVFLLANVADDIEQRISLVVRGEEHLSNAAKQSLLWQALGTNPPVWAHLPLIVNERRQKLSKRRDKVALEGYLTDGYLPDAVVNYLMLLGWGPRDGVEVRPFTQMADLFRLEDVTSSPAFFDVKKLAAINAGYIRALTASEFAEACGPWLQAPAAPWLDSTFDASVFERVAPLAQTRMTVLSEITAFVDFLFLDEPVVDEAAWDKTMTAGAAHLLADVHAGFADGDWTAAAVKAVVEAAAADRGMKLAKAQAPVRVAVTGRTIGLPLFESIETLGRDRTMIRIDAAIKVLAPYSRQP